MQRDDPPPQTPTPARDRVLATMIVARPQLVRLANRYSFCLDDAEDAVGAALEIYLRRGVELVPGPDRLWLEEVTRNEALRIRRARLRQLPTERDRFEQLEDTEIPDENAAIASYERLGRSAEALKGLTPAQIAALLERAAGFSCEEIATRHAWSARKTARSLVEGRARFRSRVEDIERGRECRRWARVVRAMGEGRASDRLQAMVRPHLAHCPSCRRALGDSPARRSRGCAG